jgi:aminomethyltransferase
MSQDTSVQKTVLYENHVALKARMVPFAGWMMPVQYSGILEEHLHTRTQAGLFDICHMGEFYVRGPHAAAAMDRLVTQRLDNLAPGQGRYGFLLNDSAKVLDDLIVFCLSGTEFFIVVNAGTRLKDAEWMASHLPEGVTFEDASDRIAKLDLQGPQSGGIMAKLAPGADISGIKRFHGKQIRLDGVPLFISRTGYTGELGYELYFDVSAADKIWNLLLNAEGVKPIGLGARDTLRLEKGMSLYGHELDEAHTPLESSLERFVYWDKEFIGREKLLRQKETGLPRILTGFVCEGRRAAREHFEVRVNDEVVGEVTSGGFSPCLSRGIGLCRIDQHLAQAGQPITLVQEKVQIPAVIQAPPFV